MSRDTTLDSAMGHYCHHHHFNLSTT